MENGRIPRWFSELNEEEINFTKKFLLASGSIKELAETYSTSYPTIRKRLDKLIQKIQVNERKENNTVVKLINQLEEEGKIDQEIAKTVVLEYSKSLNCLIVD
ncbi:DUF2089 family protein [Enterococcus hulanensis]|uniref:DUF2089 family protein n=1 Tax=Enterococcus hulanensis TaxID=2559929 RepID=A0ABU3F0H4_9ENTE|nr:DUF2089 family protein [Enterococcus hulanensis]MDT2600634.1 DUF2089 family protein [Enterococcus hulanensis]MDT2610157.1 DUF2089 family protein [Enterococcus hulanensis]MDT2617435.1 DUF2089 family protein [Enterococcus hulanensis]MDT2628102.1 DUF2089 family protein [Enterococcus hulanensis]MDT2655207.1 DUF2089 family protein [Enterococcus hulanensis]